MLASGYSSTIVACGSARRRSATGFGNRLCQQPLGLALRTAQRQQRLDLAAERLQGLALPVVERARHAVDHAQRSHRMPRRRDQRRAGIEADVGIRPDQRVVGETFIGRSVVHDHQLGLQDRMRTERHVTRRLRGRQPDPRLEVLPVLVDQRHQCDRRAADLRGQEDEVVVFRFGERVENLEPAQFVEPLLFIRRDGRAHRLLHQLRSATRYYSCDLNSVAAPSTTFTHHGRSRHASSVICFDRCRSSSKIEVSDSAKAPS